MKAVSGSFVSVEDVMDELEKIHLKLDALGVTRKELGDCGSGEVVWASQATLAKRYDMSKSNMCRLLMSGATNGKIRMCQPNGGVRKYHVADVDSYMMDISEILEWRNNREPGK